MNLKEVHSEERLIDECALFMHQDVSKLPEAKRELINRLYQAETVLKDKRVLIVDDDIRNIFAMTSLLERYQIQTFSAETGKIALEQLQTSPDIDAVLMDIMMPDMDGYDTMRAIRKFPKFRTLPMIAVTAKAMKGDREKSALVGGELRHRITSPSQSICAELLSMLRLMDSPLRDMNIGLVPGNLYQTTSFPYGSRIGFAPTFSRVVDDREDKRLAMETIIAELGQNIVQASFGARCLEAFASRSRNSPSFCSKDVNMPEMDGFETALLIRQRKSLEHVPIIFVSAISDTETHVSRGYSLGAVDYILAPIIPEILRAKVGVFVGIFKTTEKVQKAEQKAKSGQ